MTLEERTAALEAQLKTWQERRQQAAEVLNESQAAILQLQGALALARDLATPASEEVSLNGLPDRGAT